ncbi:MAG: lipoprotein-releasing ABC transporter permease subunit [Steroidobacteraceae bacterium]
MPLFVGLRYARARTHRYFVSFITWVSLAGVGVGVAALIVILSVMNGFESELRNRLLALSAPVRVIATGAERPDWAQVQQQVATVVGDGAVESYAELQVLGVRDSEMLPLMLRGAGPATARELKQLLVEGDLAPMLAGEGIVLGRLVAEQLGVVVGDPVTLLVATVSKGELPEPLLREFTVVGVFEAGIQDHDGTLAYASLVTLDDLGAARSGSEGLSVQLPDALSAPATAARLRPVLDSRWPGLLTVRDWTEDHASYFRAIKIEKTMMALILLLIVAVAAFNIVAMLVMVVNDKRTDIAILRTLGASPRALAMVFVSQGLMIGWLGVLAGVGLGVLIAKNVGVILQVLDRFTGLQLFDADVYYITQVPSELHGMDILLVAGSALVVTALATIYPAVRAAATSPAEALRYE